MACATLKRNLDWESMAQMPAKRRRCVPYPGAAAGSSPSASTSSAHLNRLSPFADTVQQVKLTPERMAQEICDEIKRLQRRRQLRLAEAGPAAASSSSGSEGDASPPPPHRAHAHEHAPPTKVHHRALFTFKQVRIICERMLREQEAALRAEYEAALSGKLAEQYEAFVRFNLDQIQRRPPPGPLHGSMEAEHHMHQDLVPSYLS